MSENFLSYFAVLSVFAIKTNFSHRDKERLHKKHLYYYMANGSLAVLILVILITMFVKSKTYFSQSILTLVFYASIFICMNIKFIFKRNFFFLDDLILGFLEENEKILPTNYDNENEEKIFKV